MRSLVLACVILQFVESVEKAGDVCGNQTNTHTAGPALPAVSSRFEAHIQMTSVDSNQTVGIMQYFDGKSGQSAITIRQGGVEKQLFLDFRHQQILHITPDQKSCQVVDLSTSIYRIYFGSLATASSVLHLRGDSDHVVYRGRSVVRGVAVTTWTSCQYWRELDAKMNVTWYFSDDNYWDSALSVGPVPVRAWVKGHAGSNGNITHDFEHVYEFYHFNNVITSPKAFETPSFVSCPKRKPTKKFPELLEAFSQSLEILTVDSQLNITKFKTVQQSYDKRMGLVKYTYRDDLHSWREVSEVHDFNTGIVYTTDLRLGNCTAHAMEYGVATASHVSLKTPLQFFHLDNSDATYEGVTLIRGMPSDRFVSRKSDFPKTRPTESFWEWHFRKGNDSANTGRLAQWRLLLPHLGKTTTYSVFDMVPERNKLKTWDVSACYSNLHRRTFKFAVSGSYKEEIEASPDKFQYGVVMSIVLICKVSPLRVANIQLMYGKTVSIIVAILDVTPIEGENVNVSKTPLDQAANLLMESFAGNDFFIYFPNSNTPYTMNPIPSSLEEVVTEGSSYSSPSSISQSPTYVSKYTTPSRHPPTYPDATNLTTARTAPANVQTPTSIASAKHTSTSAMTPGSAELSPSTVTRGHHTTRPTGGPRTSTTTVASDAMPRSKASIGCSGDGDIGYSTAGETL